MNTINITRLSIEDTGVYGHGSIDWDTFTFVTLENPGCYIPAGTYTLQWHIHTTDGQTVPLLVNVPGRTEILLHQGNYFTDSLGCILVGACRDGNAIDTSEATLVTLIQKIKDVGIETVQITII